MQDKYDFIWLLLILNYCIFIYACIFSLPCVHQLHFYGKPYFLIRQCTRYSLKRVTMTTMSNNNTMQMQNASTEMWFDIWFPCKVDIISNLLVSFSGYDQAKSGKCLWGHSPYSHILPCMVHRYHRYGHGKTPKMELTWSQLENVDVDFRS